MKVIVASYSKCGTKTMASALRQLGLVVYDFVENFENLEKDWMRILEKGTNAEELRKMYEGVDAVTDLPCSLFWEELLEAFPDAKVVYSKRQSEDEWLESLRYQTDVFQKSFQIPMLFSKTARKFKFYLDKMSCIEYSDSVITKMLFGKTFFNEVVCRRAYRLHNNYIEKKAPKDQLLLFDLQSGWEPLCEFLDEKVPDEDFPHENKGASLTRKCPEKGLQTATRIKQEMSCFILIVLLVFFLPLAYYCSCYICYHDSFDLVHINQ